MKKLSTIALLLVLSTAWAFAQKPVIKFDKTTHDFGTMKEADGRVTTVFEFTNEGAGPLVISKVRASCGCTTPNWTRTPIEPGQKGTVTVTYNPLGRQGGPWQKSITVTSNAETETVRLIIKGNTISKAAQPVDAYPIKIYGLGLKARSYQFNNIKKGATVQRTIELANNTKEPVTIDLVAEDKFLEVAGMPDTIQPGKVGQLHVRFNSKNCKQWGPIRTQVYLIVNGKKEYTDANKLDVIANIVEDFASMSTAERQQAPIVEFTTRTVDLGTLKAGEKKTAKVAFSNKGKNALAIRRIVNNNKDLTVTSSKSSINGGKKADLKVEVNTTGMKTSTYRRNITVITNDPDRPHTMISITWKIE